MLVSVWTPRQLASRSRSSDGNPSVSLPPRRCWAAMRPGSPDLARDFFRLRSQEQQQQQNGNGLSIRGEGLQGSTPAWVTRLSRPSTAPGGARYLPGLSGRPGSMADEPQTAPYMPAAPGKRQPGSRRPGVPSWVDRLANKPARGRAASPRRSSADLVRPGSAAISRCDCGALQRAQSPASYEQRLRLQFCRPTALLSRAASCQL